MNMMSIRKPAVVSGLLGRTAFTLCLAIGCVPSAGQTPSGREPSGRTGGSPAMVPSGTGGGGGGAGGTGGTGAGTGGSTSAGGNGGNQPTNPGGLDTASPAQDMRPAGMSPTDGATSDTAGPSRGDGNVDSGNKPPAVPSAGCTAAAQLPEGQGTLPSGRRYIVHLPTSHEKTKPYPLVFANHPNGGNIGMFGDQKTRAVMRDWAILVLTQSQTGDWRQAFAEDLAYFDALVPLLKEKLCIDTGRIYSFGFSGGASFSNLLACKRDFLRAVAGGGGIPGYNGYTAADCKPMPAWIDEGDRAGLVELWTAKNGCSQQLPTNRANCKAYVCTAAPVVYCTNGEHSWPAYGSKDVAAFFKQF
ncbi:MAG TPA: hypothetical protein VGF45_16115 [Polyangia bacterium]